MDTKNNQFWYFLLRGILDKDTGAYGNFYAYGQHCGEALENALKGAMTRDVSNLVPIETSRLDTLEEFELPSDAIEVIESVFMRPELHIYDLEQEDNYFICPKGILKGTGNDEDEYELISEKFVAYNKDENGVFELEMVVDRDKLSKTFLETINYLPSVDGFWVYIWNHWEDEQTELWVGKAIVDKKGADNFLTKNKASTLENGYIDCVVHSQIGETNLILDDHKKIQLYTKDENIFKNFIKSIKELGFGQTEDFYNIEFDFFHWHYRPFNSLSRDDFKTFLKLEDFELLDQWD